MVQTLTAFNRKVNLMSYDLYFLLGDDPAVSKQDFAAFFEARENYAIFGDRDPQASYENEDTGVGFSFEWSEAEPDEDVEEFLRGPHVAFNLNFYRPEFFALEALPELEAFTRAFGGRVHDPQIDGIKNGAFASDGFLSGWRAGNSAAYKVLIPQQDHLPYSVPKLLNESVWRWNYQKKALQQLLGEDSFVPRVFYFSLANEKSLKHGVIWPDGIPMVLPPDIDVLVLLKTVTTKRLLIFNGPTETINIGAVPAAALPQDIPRERAKLDEIPYTIIGAGNGRMLPSIDGFYRKADEIATPVTQMLTVDQVLDRETLEAVANNSDS